LEFARNLRICCQFATQEEEDNAGDDESCKFTICNTRRKKKKDAGDEEWTCK
jgi:hypothetical protein